MGRDAGAATLPVIDAPGVLPTAPLVPPSPAGASPSSSRASRASAGPGAMSIASSVLKRARHDQNSKASVTDAERYRNETCPRERGLDADGNVTYTPRACTQPAARCHACACDCARAVGCVRCRLTHGRARRPFVALPALGLPRLRPRHPAVLRLPAPVRHTYRCVVIALAAPWSAAAKLIKINRPRCARRLGGLFLFLVPLSLPAYIMYNAANPKAPNISRFSIANLDAVSDVFGISKPVVATIVGWLDVFQARTRPATGAQLRNSTAPDRCS
jgi:hypothetical protein